MYLEQILNEALNEAMCNTNRIKNPNSNKVAQFVSEFMERKEFKYDSLNRVSQQRELLIDFMGKLTVNDHEGTIQDTVDRYLKSINCC